MQRRWAEVFEKLKEHRGKPGITDDKLFTIARRLRGVETSFDAYERAARRAGFDRPTPDPGELVVRAVVQSERSSLKASIKALTEEVRALQAKAHIIEEIKGNEPRIVERKPPAHGRRVATAVALLSDAHVEERVDLGSVNGRNEYNPDIARQRLRKFFEGFAWLIRHHRGSFDIEDAILWLGGDLLTGYIHEELLESNYMSPTETILFLLEELIAGIDMILSLGVSLKVPCNFGNHGRTTPKRRVSTGKSNSFEWLLYQFLRLHMADRDGLEFVVADGDHIYMDVYDFTLRFHHGDNFNYSGGVGGISPPLLRGISRLESFRHADYTFIGHFHQYADFGSIMVNGSVIGYGPYSVKINAPYEKPQQAFCLIDSRHGKCQTTQIWLEDIDEKDE